VADDNGSAGADSSTTAADLAQIIAPLAAVIAVLASLAVAGVISNAQRDHGDELLWAFGLIVLSATLWLLALVLPAPKKEEPTPASSPPPTRILEGQTPFGGVALELRTESPAAVAPPATESTWWQRIEDALWVAGRIVRVVFRILAVVLLAAGIVLATHAMIKTQGDAQRPAVVATFDASKGVLTANVTAEGLRTEQRMSVRVDGLQQSPTTASSVQAVDINKPLYLALLGPDGSGKVAYKFTVYVPPDFNIVGVEAWTAKTRPGCFDVAALKQSEEAGCAIVRLKPRPITRVAQKVKRRKP
jgi:hypothetical protein